MKNFLQRLKLAASIVFKDGAPFPFNKILPYDSLGGEKLYRPYEHSTWVMRAIKKISGPIAAVDLNFTRAGQAWEDADVEAFWQQPGLNMTRSDFFEATVGWLKLEGEAFWIMDDSWASPFAAQRSPLVIPPPSRMHHIIKGGELVGWDYVDGKGQHNALLPEQVIQVKFWNPYSQYRGASEFLPCKNAAEADYLADRFNLNLMRSNGDQGVYVVCKNGLLDDNQRQMVTDQLREKHELAQRGVYKPVFMGGDITVEDPKIRVPDDAFNNTRLQNRHQIFIAMGVPPSMADIKASYSIGSASDWYQLIMETCIPTGQKICTAVNQVLRRQTGLVIESELEWDEHPVLQAVRRERADTAAKYFAMGVPLETLNEYLALGLPESAGWDKGWLPVALQPVEEADALPETPPAEDLDDAIALMRQTLDPVERLKRALREGRR